MTKIGKILLAAALVLLPSLSWADEPSLELTVDRTQAAPGEPITAQVTVNGKASAPQPVLKNTADFGVRPAGASSRIQIVNGQYSSSKVFHFLLTPKAPGTYTIGPAEIEMGGKTYQSGTVILTIAKNEPQPADPSEAGDRAAFVTAEVSNDHPYVNQQIVYTLRFYNRVPIRGSEVRPPDFAGFRKEQLGDVRHFQKTVNGQNWEVNEIRWALYPVSSGDTEIGSADIVANLVLPSKREPFRDPFFDDDPFFKNSPFRDDPFFGGIFQRTQQKQFSADAMTVRVRPLPEEGKPQDFSGLVGAPRLSAQLSAKDVEVGGSATLTLTVQGSGDIRNVPAPELPGGSDFKSYDDQPVFKPSTGGEGLEGTKIFKKAIVPLKAGDLKIPPFKISYFDPASGQYQTVATDPMDLHVRPSSHPESALVTTAPTPETGAASPAPLRLPTFSPRAKQWIIIAVAVFIFLLLAAWLLRRQSARRKADPLSSKRKKAGKAALAAARELERASGREFAERAAFILRNYLSDKAGIDAGSLTPAEAHARLEPLGVSSSTAEEIRKFLEQCDAAVFGGQAASPEERARLLETLKDVIGRAGREIAEAKPSTV